MKFTPRPYQERADRFVHDHQYCALFIDMGLGKTATILSVLTSLIFNEFTVRRALIIAPKRVATIVWPEEIAKWDDFSDIRHTVLHGNKKLEALEFKAPGCDVLVINYEGIRWLAENAEKVPIFDMIILDESTFVKNPDSKRFGMLSTFMHKIPRRVILTGKPMPNGLQDLWAQFFLLDGGKRLGSDYKLFLQRYFLPIDPYSRKLFPYRESRKNIADIVADITLNMRREDYLDMPDFLVNEIRFDLPKKILKKYKYLEREFVMALPSGETLIVNNEAAMSMKLRQFIAGFVYTDLEGTAEWLHKERLKVLAEIRDANPGKSLLIAIQFTEEVDLIRTFLKNNIPVINSTTSDTEGAAHLAAWNKGELQELLVHPSSVAHGLNMQFGGHLLVIFSQGWNLDHDDQLIKRLDRPGQKEQVIVHRIIARGTLDETMAASLRNKDRQQEGFLKVLQ